MVLQIIAGLAWLIWLTSGTAGLGKSLMVGVLLVIGIGARNLLDTFWKEKPAEKKTRRSEDESEKLYWFSPRMKMTFPCPNWSRAARDIPGSSSILLRRVEAR